MLKFWIVWIEMMRKMKKQFKKTAVVAMAALTLATGGAITKGISAEVATYTQTLKVNVPSPLSNVMGGLNGYKAYLVASNGQQGLLGTMESIKNASIKTKLTVTGTHSYQAKVCFRNMASKQFTKCVTSDKFTVSNNTFKNQGLTITVSKSGVTGLKVTTNLNKK